MPKRIQILFALIVPLEKNLKGSLNKFTGSTLWCKKLLCDTDMTEKFDYAVSMKTVNFSSYVYLQYL